MNRRELLALLIAGSAAAFTLAGRTRAAPATAARVAAPSLTRAAAVHDALTLLVSDADVTGEWQDALLPLPVAKPWEFSYAYGTASLHDDGQIVHDVVAEVRSGWTERQPAFMDLQRYKGGMLQRKLMVALGWAADRAGAHALFAGLPGDNAATVVDGVFLRALAGIGRLDATRAKRILRVLYERALVAMHTIEPDLDGWGDESIAAMHELKNPAQDDVALFMDAYADWIENVDQQCERLAASAARRAPAGYPDGAEFYDRSDALIAKVEGLRRGTGTASRPGSWHPEHVTSRYAKSVASAYRNARLVFDVARGGRPETDLSGLAGTGDVSRRR